jgi:hypothetical protein
MSPPAFTKFDPRSFLQAEKRQGTSSKLAKLAKLAKGAEPKSEQSASSAALATLASRGLQSESNSLAPNIWTKTDDERAAIIEYDRAAPRRWAEALARLNPASPPSEVPARRWVQFIDDCGRFLDNGWGSRAEALSWGPFDLFGCDRDRPFARIDRAGLLWLINGSKVVALTTETATIETSAGHRQTFQRRPTEIGSVVLAWDLNPTTSSDRPTGEV